MERARREDLLGLALILLALVLLLVGCSADLGPKDVRFIDIFPNVVSMQPGDVRGALSFAFDASGEPILGLPWRWRWSPSPGPADLETDNDYAVLRARPFDPAWPDSLDRVVASWLIAEVVGVEGIADSIPVIVYQADDPTEPATVGEHHGESANQIR